MRTSKNRQIFSVQGDLEKSGEYPQPEACQDGGSSSPQHRIRTTEAEDPSPGRSHLGSSGEILVL